MHVPSAVRILLECMQQSANEVLSKLRKPLNIQYPTPEPKYISPQPRPGALLKQ